MRAISTVVDVMVCLLLLSAAIVAVTLPATESAPERTVDETATVLATTTADIEYRLSAEALNRAGPDDSGTVSSGTTDRPAWLGDRKRHGTLAGLLARAAVTNASYRGHRLAPEAAPFRASVRTEANAVLPERIAVRARWEPYPDAPISGTVTAGETPPPDVSVQTATLRVPLPELAADIEPTETAEYDTIAGSTADAIVSGLLPATRGELSTDDGLVRSALDHRYRVLAGEAPIQVTRLLLGDRVESLNGRVSNALAQQLAADMRVRFDSPAAAAAAVNSGTVWLTVERWSP